MQFALQSRPDLQALELLYAEAEQRERLEIANRFGNPSFGAKTEYNESSVTFVGATVQFPIPVFNSRRGEVLQRQAEKAKVLMDRRRLVMQIHQDVLAALDRLHEAQKWVRSFESDILPTLRKTLDAFDQLFAQGEPGVDVLRLIEVRRRYLRARDGLLDAQWEWSQARADLAAAIGDFTLATETAPVQPMLGAPLDVPPAPCPARGR
jgi:outer membrane protein TolC